MVAEASGHCPGLEGGTAEGLGAGGILPPPDTPVLALLLFELLATESCFFLELLNLTLPESVSFNFSNNLLIGLSMMPFFRPVWAK